MNAGFKLIQKFQTTSHNFLNFQDFRKQNHGNFLRNSTHPGRWLPIKMVRNAEIHRCRTSEVNSWDGTWVNLMVFLYNIK